jgi:hypothetical protein
MRPLMPQPPFNLGPQRPPLSSPHICDEPRRPPDAATRRHHRAGDEKKNSTFINFALFALFASKITTKLSSKMDQKHEQYFPGIEIIHKSYVRNILA